jgi:shikimate dehydrogenase
MSAQLNGATRLFPILGDPVAYVESPVRLTRTFAERGHNGLCLPMHVSAADLDAVMAGLSATGNVDGVLVTMPHKRTASGHCATLSERARRLGVVSVLRRTRDGTWHGDMIDGIAFVKAQRDHGALIEGRRALLVGAGGAGSAIACALLDEGVGELVVHDVDEARAEAAVEIAGDPRGRVRTGANDPRGFDLVFNATPLGTKAGDSLPLDTSSLDASTFVGDVVAGHGITPVIEAARAAGCETATGGQMVEAVQDLMADFMPAPASNDPGRGSERASLPHDASPPVRSARA